MADRSIYIK